jgi:acetyl-CoA carboxylase biotin carboxyl carrier protein
MDLRKLKKLIDLVEESGIAELEITEGEEKVRIARTLPGIQPMVMQQPQQIVAAPAPVAAAPTRRAARPSSTSGSRSPQARRSASSRP